MSVVVALTGKVSSRLRKSRSVARATLSYTTWKAAS